MSDRGRVLVADDEETFRRSTCDLLRRSGYECEGAPDAGAVKEMLDVRPYDVVIADVKMPGNSDLELVRELKEGTAITIILVTGYPSLETALLAMRLRVCYLVKPFDFEELLEHVHKAVSRSRLTHGFSRLLELIHGWDAPPQPPRLPPAEAFSEALHGTSRLLAEVLECLKEQTGEAGGEARTKALLREALDVLGNLRLRGRHPRIGELIERIRRYLESG